MPLKLIVANKAYSSWSQRAWILLAHFKIPFEETVIPLDLPETHAKILKHSPNGKVPALIDGPITVWESLSVIEYVAETHPEKAIWPRGKAARAHARSLAAEMHAGFQGLRQACPVNFRRPVRKLALSEAAVADVARIEAAWAHARKTFGKAGPFLFGRFSAADAMFAPVIESIKELRNQNIGLSDLETARQKNDELKFKGLTDIINAQQKEIEELKRKISKKH